MKTKFNTLKNDKGIKNTIQHAKLRRLRRLSTPARKAASATAESHLVLYATLFKSVSCCLQAVKIEGVEITPELSKRSLQPRMPPELVGTCDGWVAGLFMV